MPSLGWLSLCPWVWGLGEGVTLGFIPLSFPSDLLLTSSTGELWRMVRIGGQPLGFGECGRGGHVPSCATATQGVLWGTAVPVCPHGRDLRLPLPPDECGIVAQIAEPLAAADISAYYISTFNFDHALVSPCPSLGTPATPGVSPEADTPCVPGRSPRRASLR